MTLKKETANEEASPFTIDKVIAAICGGLVETYSIDPKIVRLITVLLALVLDIIPFVIVCIVAWIIVPTD